MEVLVVDDEPIAREITSHTLVNAGYSVLTANDGVEALEILNRGICQLVVTDWEMPVMGGAAFCRAVRDGRFSRYIYTIVVTAKDRYADFVQCLASGADDYISKPCQPAELIMRVNAGRRMIGVGSHRIVVFTLTRLAESRIPGWAERAGRMRRYCRDLAARLCEQKQFLPELDENFVELIFETAALCDLGKVSLPDEILHRRGPFTAEEIKMMQQHTLAGGEVLKAAVNEYPNAPFLKMACDLAVSHHECYDGSGYPHGLKADRIPLCGRIAAVAAAYDELTEPAEHGHPLSHHQAIDQIVKGSGTRFDPHVVDALAEIQDRFNATAEC